MCDPKEKAGARPRLWRLNETQYAKTVASLFSGRSAGGNKDLKPPPGSYPFAASIESDRFSTLADSYSVLEQELRDSMRSAQDVAAQMVAAPWARACVTTEPSFDQCLQALVKEKGELLFRRPLTADETARYVAVATKVVAAAGRSPAAALAFTAMLMAPQFLFRSELGVPAGSDPSVRKLTPYEIATAISFSITDAPPDRPLWEAASSGALAQTAVMGQHVARLLAAPAELTPVVDFFAEYFRYRKQVNKVRDFPSSQLVSQSDLFVQDVLATSARKDLLASLLTSKVVFANDSSASTYGVMKPTKVTRYVLEDDRAGILGQGSWLGAYSQPERTDPIKRGRFVRESLLCREVPAVPIEGVTPLSTDKNLTLRQKLAMHVSKPACKVCHESMDPIGLGLEAFDEVGKRRAVEVGRPVDTTGALVGSGDQDGPFNGLTELAGKLAASRAVSECFVSHTFEYWMGRKATIGDSCALEAAHQAYQGSGGDYVAMMQALFTSDSFLSKRL